MRSHIAPEFRIELVCDVEQIGVQHGDVEAEERLMVCDPVAKLLETADAFVDVWPTSTRWKREMECGPPECDLVRRRREVTPEPESQLRDNFPRRCGVTAGPTDRSLQSCARLDVDVDADFAATPALAGAEHRREHLAAATRPVAGQFEILGESPIACVPQPDLEVREIMAKTGAECGIPLVELDSGADIASTASR